MTFHFPDNPRHPLYRTIKLVSCLTALTVILWTQASSFDQTELRTIFWFFTATLGIEGAGEVLRQVRSDG